MSTRYYEDHSRSREKGIRQNPLVAHLDDRTLENGRGNYNYKSTNATSSSGAKTPSPRRRDHSIRFPPSSQTSACGPAPAHQQHHHQPLQTRCFFRFKHEESANVTVKLVGSVPQLGAWDIEKAVELVTTPDYFPCWISQDPVLLPLGEMYFVCKHQSNMFSRSYFLDRHDRLIPTPVPF